MSCEPEMGYNNVIFTHLHCHATVGGRMGFMDYIFSFEIHNILLSFLVLRLFGTFERELLLFTPEFSEGRMQTKLKKYTQVGTFLYHIYLIGRSIKF